VSVLLLAGSLATGQETPTDPGAIRHELLAEINRARMEQGRAALQASEALTRAAQTRAEQLSAAGTLDSAGIPGEDLLGRAKRAGYPVAAISEVVAQADGPHSEIVGYWRRRADSIWQDVVSERHRELGIGVSSLDGVPLYVFLFGVTTAEAFAERTEGIRNGARVRRELLAAINRERASHRLPPLRVHPQLELAAQRHADDMLNRGYYGHASPEGAMVLERTRRAGYPAQSVGENIAKGQTSVAEVVEGWMGSPEHRRNILDHFFRETGFGIAIGRMPEGERVLWVNVFGEPRGSRR
jgi:uncharacterized protein YkwD